MMNHKKRPDRSSLKHSLFTPDPSRRMHFLHLKNLGTSIQQFEEFQHWLTSAGVQNLRPSSLTLACLIAFDGIATDTELKAAYSSCPQVSRCETAVRLDWKIGSRLDARHLSVWTTLALARVKEWEPYDLVCKHLVDTLCARTFKIRIPPTAGRVREPPPKTGVGWFKNPPPTSLGGLSPHGAAG